MEVDTGASVSLISETTFNTIQNGVARMELKDTATRLHTYTGESIAVRGSTVAQVVHCGQTLELPLIVSAGDGPALLGRDWLSALRLDWKSIFSVGNNPTLQGVLEKHAEAFKEGLGELRPPRFTSARMLDRNSARQIVCHLLFARESRRS